MSQDSDEIFARLVRMTISRSCLKSKTWKLFLFYTLVSIALAYQVWLYRELGQSPSLRNRKGTTDLSSFIHRIKGKSSVFSSNSCYGLHVGLFMTALC